MCEHHTIFYRAKITKLPTTKTVYELKNEIKVETLKQIPIIKLYGDGTGKLIFWDDKSLSTFIKNTEYSVAKYNVDMGCCGSKKPDEREDKYQQIPAPAKEYSAFIPLTTGLTKLLQRNPKFIHMHIVYEGGLSITGTEADIELVRQQLMSIKQSVYRIEQPGAAVHCTLADGKRKLKKIEDSYTVSCELVYDGYNYIDIIHGNLFQQQCGALVTTVDEHFQPTCQVSATLFEKEKDLQAYCINKYKQAKKGEVFILSSSSIITRRIMLVVGETFDRNGLHEILKSILKTCETNRIPSIAMSFLLAGKDGYMENHEKAMLTIYKATKNFYLSKPEFPRKLLIFEKDPTEAVELSTILKQAISSESTIHKNPDNQMVKCYGDVVVVGQGVKIELVRGVIAEERTTVIVNSVGWDLDKEKGAISKSLHEVAGPDLQAHFQDRALELRPVKQQGGTYLIPGDIISTESGKLKCKKVYHVYCGIRDENEIAKIVRTIISDCLVKAHTKGYSSISFPAIGTGALGLPNSDAAKIMYDVAIAFALEYPATQLRTIRFVLYSGNDDLIKEFENESMNRDKHRAKRGNITISHIETMPAMTFFKIGYLKLNCASKQPENLTAFVTEPTQGPINDLIYHPEIITGQPLRISFNTQILVTPNDWKKAVFACLRIVDRVGFQSIAFDGRPLLKFEEEVVVNIFAETCAEWTMHYNNRHTLAEVILYNLTKTQINVFKTFSQQCNAVISTIKGAWGHTKQFLGFDSPSPGPISADSQAGQDKRDSLDKEAAYDVCDGLSLRIYSIDNVNLEKAVQELRQVFPAPHIQHQLQVSHVASNLSQIENEISYPEDQATDNNEDANMQEHARKRNHVIDPSMHGIQAKKRNHGIDPSMHGIQASGRRLASDDVVTVNEHRPDQAGGRSLASDSVVAVNEHRPDQAGGRRLASNTVDVINRPYQADEWNVASDKTFAEKEQRPNQAGGRRLASDSVVVVNEHRPGQADKRNEASDKTVADKEQRPNQGYHSTYTRLELNVMGATTKNNRISESSSNFLKHEFGANDSILNSNQATGVTPTAMTVKLPGFEDNETFTISSIGDPTLVQVEQIHPGSRDYTLITTKFKEGADKDFTISEIVKVKNDGLHNRLKLHEMYMRKKNHPQTVKQMLWHGSKRELIDTIVTNGFNRSYSGLNATFFGKGVYFARDLEYACRDTYAQLDESGYKYVYYCEVLTGEYTVGTKNISDAPPRDPQQPHIRYDSTINDVNDPKVFVVFRDSQAYPKYLIKFR